jgi:hypothetical protein
MRLNKRKLAELAQKGVIRQEVDGSITQLKPDPAAPGKLVDNKNRSWKVHDFERDWDGYITSVMITEVT